MTPNGAPASAHGPTIVTSCLRKGRKARRYRLHHLRPGGRPPGEGGRPTRPPHRPAPAGPARRDPAATRPGNAPTATRTGSHTPGSDGRRAGQRANGREGERRAPATTRAKPRNLKQAGACPCDTSPNLNTNLCSATSCGAGSAAARQSNLYPLSRPLVY